MESHALLGQASLYDVTPLLTNDVTYAQRPMARRDRDENLSDFGLALPPTATITGIRVEVDGRSSASTVTFKVNLSWGNGIGGLDDDTATQTRTFATTETPLTLGDPTRGVTPGRAAELSTFWLRISKTHSQRL